MAIAKLQLGLARLIAGCSGSILDMVLELGAGVYLP